MKKFMQKKPKVNLPDSVRVVNPGGLLLEKANRNDNAYARLRGPRKQKFGCRHHAPVKIISPRRHCGTDQTTGGRFTA
jgi:hypothetical protein